MDSSRGSAFPKLVVPTNLLGIFTGNDHTGGFPTPREGEEIVISPQGQTVVFQKSLSYEGSKSPIKETSPFDMTLLQDSPCSKSSTTTRSTFVLTTLGEMDSDDESDSVLLIREEEKGERISSCVRRSLFEKVRRGWTRVKTVLKRTSWTGADPVHDINKPKLQLPDMIKTMRDRSMDHASKGESGYDYIMNDYDAEGDDILSHQETEGLWSTAN